MKRITKCLTCNIFTLHIFCRRKNRIFIPKQEAMVPFVFLAVSCLNCPATRFRWGENIVCRIWIFPTFFRRWIGYVEVVFDMYLFQRENRSILVQPLCWPNFLRTWMCSWSRAKFGFSSRCKEALELARFRWGSMEIRCVLLSLSLGVYE